MIDDKNNKGYNMMDGWRNQSQWVEYDYFPSGNGWDVCSITKAVYKR